MNKLILILAVLSGCILGMGVMSFILTRTITEMEIGLTEIHQLEMETERIKQDDLQAQLSSAIIDRDNFQNDLEDLNDVIEWVFEDKERVEEFFAIYTMATSDMYDEDELNRRIDAFEEACYQDIGLRFE